MYSLSLFLSFLLLPILLQTYQVTFQRINGGLPAISSLNFKKQKHATSVFKWNYNAAVVLSANNSNTLSLLVRCQDQGNSGPFSVTPSVLAYTDLVARTDDFYLFRSIRAQDVVFTSQEPYENYGVEDPRIVVDKDGTYFMLYSAVQDYHNGTITSRLALATTKTPSVNGSWQRHGPLFPNGGWSKSGAMLIREKPPHYLLFGDTSERLQVALSDDLYHWKLQSGTMLDKRPNKFDRDLIEAGPMPLPLSDGNYFFIYNSARTGYPSVKPGFDFQYNVGWAVLDKNLPTKVVQRCDEPLIAPTLTWETGNKGVDELDLTPNVVFVEGWARFPGAANDTFLVFYGGADSVIGVGKVVVNVKGGQKH